ncbi:TPA: DGQHR domain-containing protein [Vibrio cholerae]|uniref:DGQHR domain-containing protein n=1 Tax=Vibrio cholerae TaxID=666 RepID=UPI001DCEBBD5|nr:DGQHR domain-containing protein [Vibrio cholerae]EGR4283136.1 DGQHR domain-containing protein [Vibrio cholerae]HBK7253954.1 DGQHR domain-containing protein [Vibrio cholerae]
MKCHIFKAIKVSQPFSDYYICKIPSDILRTISYTLKAVNNDGEVQGVQRTLNSKRLQEIAQFIDSDSGAFPNPIILGANFKESGRYADENEKIEFEVIDEENCIYNIKVPYDSQLLSIIDGQHRLFAFDQAQTSMDLACSIYEDLATPFQAFLFSTINYNQGKVDKSLAYQLFGYEIDSREPIEWPPETLAVYFVRQLNKEEPLLNRVKYRTADEKNITKNVRDALPPWRFSTSSIVEAILSLISHNPKEDRYLMNTKKNAEAGNIVGRSVLNDDVRYPLRKLYIDGNDKAISDVLRLALNATNDIFWTKVDDDNFLKKTVGIACVFKYLKAVLIKDGVSLSTMKDKFPKYLELIKAQEDFSDSDTYSSTTKAMNKAYERMLELSGIQ